MKCDLVEGYFSINISYFNIIDNIGKQYYNAIEVIKIIKNVYKIIQ